MSFDLAFWHEDRPITAEQALQIYLQLCDGNDSVVKSHPNIAVFLHELTQHYPPIGDYPEEKLDAYPWSCDWSLTPGSVLTCMTWSRGREMAPHLIEMANRRNLVVYNPQDNEVALPSSLAFL